MKLDMWMEDGDGEWVGQDKYCKFIVFNWMCVCQCDLGIMVIVSFLEYVKVEGD